MSDPSKAVDLPAEFYPFTVEFIGEESGETLQTDYIEGPGVHTIPGQDHWGEPVWVRVTYNDGSTYESHYYKEENDG